MPFCSATRLERAGWPGLRRWLVLALLLIWGMSVARAADVAQLRVERAEDGVYLSANMRLDIPPPVEDALLKGISLIFVAEAEIYKERWYWTDKRISQASRSLRLSFQPLTRRWRLSQGATEGAGQAGRVSLTQQFDTLAEAVSTLENLARWRVADAADIDPGTAYQLSFRFRLDVGQLPRPFQIGIAGQKDWQVVVEQRQPLRLQPRRSSESNSETVRP
jgi:hypothetical protein